MAVSLRCILELTGSGSPRSFVAPTATCGLSVESGSLTVSTSERSGSSSRASGQGSGHDAMPWHATSSALYPYLKKLGAMRASTAENSAGNGRCVRITTDFCIVSKLCARSELYTHLHEPACNATVAPLLEPHKPVQPLAASLVPSAVLCRLVAVYARLARMMGLCAVGEHCLVCPGG